MGFNKVFLLGNLGSDIKVRHLPDGRPVANVNVATSETWRDQEGNRHKHTEWHRLNFFGRQAEVASEFMHKGSMVFIEGQLRTRTWQDNNNVERQTTEIRVINFQMIGSRRGEDDADIQSGQASQPSSQPSTQPSTQPAERKAGGAEVFNDMDEDIPW